MRLRRTDKDMINKDFTKKVDDLDIKADSLTQQLADTVE